VQVVATLCHLRADVHAIDKQSGSCLMLTVDRNDLACCQVLLSALADPCRVDKDDATPLLRAIEGRRHDMAFLLQEHARAHYVTLLPSELDRLYAQDDGSGRVVEEVQKVLVNFMLLAKVPVDYLVCTINHWRAGRAGPGGGGTPSNRWPEADASRLESWPAT